MSEAVELSRIEQSLEQFSMQKKQFQQQLMEVEATLKEISSKDAAAYKIIGNLLVKKSPVALKKELQEKEETLKVRLASIDKQEAKLRSQVKNLQKKAMKK